MVATKVTTSAHRIEATPGPMDCSGHGPRTWRYHQAPSSAKDPVTEVSEQFTELTWRHGTRTDPANRSAAMRSRFAAIRVRPANRTIPRAEDGSLPMCWLIAEVRPRRSSPPTTGSPRSQRTRHWPSW